MTDAVMFRGRALRATKRFFLGTHRSSRPEETFERIRPYFQTIGLTRLANITGLDQVGVPVFQAIRPNSPTLSSCAGKGLTYAAARVSAVMEAIETYHAENVQTPSVLGSYSQLSTQSAIISLENLPLPKHALFSVDWPQQWVFGWDLVHQQEVAVPFALVSLKPVGSQSMFDRMSYFGDSNGLASGNNLLEAVSSALLELIERDALACRLGAWERGGPAPPRLALETIPFESVRQLLERLRLAELGTVVYDCTIDTCVPVYAALVFDARERHSGLFRGSGAHLDPEIAIVRALTEAVQGRLVYIAGSRDDLLRRESLSAHLHDDPTMQDLLHVGELVDARERTSEATPTFEGDVRLLSEKLSGAGLTQSIVIDLTHSGFDVSVVRLIVPGLEGYRFDHYAPGRRAIAFLDRVRS